MRCFYYINCGYAELVTQLLFLNLQVDLLKLLLNLWDVVDLAIETLDGDDQIIGGPDIIVEIGESKFGK